MIRIFRQRNQRSRLLRYGARFFSRSIFAARKRCGIRLVFALDYRHLAKRRFISVLSANRYKCRPYGTALYRSVRAYRRHFRIRRLPCHFLIGCVCRKNECRQPSGLSHQNPNARLFHADSCHGRPRQYPDCAECFPFSNLRGYDCRSAFSRVKRSVFYCDDSFIAAAPYNRLALQITLSEAGNLKLLRFARIHRKLLIIQRQRFICGRLNQILRGIVGVIQFLRFGLCGNVQHVSADFRMHSHIRFRNGQLKRAAFLRFYRSKLRACDNNSFRIGLVYRNHGVFGRFISCVLDLPFQPYLRPVSA